jgi:hypothetical protein
VEATGAAAATGAATFLPFAAGVAATGAAAATAAGAFAPFAAATGAGTTVSVLGAAADFVTFLVAGADIILEAEEVEEDILRRTYSYSGHRNHFLLSFNTGNHFSTYRVRFYFEAMMAVCHKSI